MPALEDADLDWSRADRSVEAGMVHVASVPDLLGADVVLADLHDDGERQRRTNSAYATPAAEVDRADPTRGRACAVRPEGAARMPIRHGGHHAVGRRGRSGVAGTVWDLRQAAAVDATSDSPLFDLFEIDPVPTVHPAPGRSSRRGTHPGFPLGRSVRTAGLESAG
ncbi:MAG: hypothetical protein R2705_21255 [Ilumatobacteraceae bacterium]